MSEALSPSLAPRLRSLDAYRGFVMLLMASGGFGLATIASQSNIYTTWDTVAAQFEHVDWQGCSLWDLIQPSFMFIVGVAMPFSYASRAAKGQAWGKQFGHALARSAILVALGVFLASNWERQTNFVFTNVLAQIGLGYWFVFLMLGRRPAIQFAVAVAILVADWYFFARYPIQTVREVYGLRVIEGLPANWRFLEGFASHWEKNANAAQAFDTWFLNLFPREEPFRYNPGGYATLNFVPSIATMLFGVLAGEWLRTNRSARTKVLVLIIVGSVCLQLGLLIDARYCPIVKRIWTPSWVIYSTGWTTWLLAVFYLVIDVLGYRRWAFPLVVVGLNSIAMYMMAQLMKPWVRDTIVRHVGTLFGWMHDRFAYSLSPDVFTGRFAPVFESLSVLFVLWLICLWMYRRQIFLRI